VGERRRRPLIGRYPMREYWNHNTAFHPELVAAVPGPGARVLDIGCGDGLLLERLSARAGHAVGVEPDAATVRAAQARLAGARDVEIVHSSFLEAEFDSGPFDLVTCVAALHHMPLRPALERMKALTAAGGQIRVVGLAADRTVTDHLLAAALVVPVRLVSLARRESAYPGMVTAEPRESLREIRAVASEILPGHRLRRRFHYRYTLTWTKPRRQPGDGSQRGLRR